MQQEKMKSNEDATRPTLPSITKYNDTIASFYDLYDFMIIL